jgi:hypothetical protein
MNQIINQHHEDNLFQQLSEQAFILQSIPNIESNIFLVNMLDFVYQLPQFSNHQFTINQHQMINGAFSRYFQIMYDCYVDNIYNDEHTIEITEILINTIASLTD